MVKLEALAAPSTLSLGLVLFAGGFAAQLTSVLISGHDGGSPLVWLPGGFLLAVLMTVPLVRWPSCVLGAVLGVVTAASLPGGSTAQGPFPLVLTLALVPIGAYAMHIVRYDTSPLRTFRSLAWFLGVFAIALPAISSAAIVIGFAAEARVHDLPEWMHVALSHALGYLVFAPMWFRPRARWATLQRMFVPSPWPAISALLAVAAVGFLWGTLGTISYLQPLLLLAPIPLLVFTALRARVTGAYFIVVLVAIVAIQLSRRGLGPFIDANASLTALALKSWIVAMGIASWLLAVLIEQRVDMRRALVDSSREVRELAGRLLEAQELERSRIARDLHDDVNQRLASMSIELSSIRRHADEHSKADLAHVQDELISLSEDVRQISHNLHPSMLHETGLDAALGSLCNTQRHRNGPAIDLCVMPNADNLPDAVALCVYRVAQEALANSVRHARAKQIDVRLAIVDAAAELDVVDDGVGFTTNRDRGQPRGLGLLSLEERAKLLGGSFQLNTTPGKGTRICVRIPLRLPRPPR